MESTARQPEVSGKIQMIMFIGLALVEVLGLLGFVAALIVSETTGDDSHVYSTLKGGLHDDNSRK